VAGNLHIGHNWFFLEDNDLNTTLLMKQSLHIDINNTIGLGWWKNTDIEFSEGQPKMIATLTPPLEISVASMEAERTEEVVATMTMPPDKPATNGGKSSLSGVPPPMFNGDRDKSELFLDKFLGYELINADAKQFTTPYLKVALCLSYITGPKVDAWAKQKRAWLQSQYKTHHVPMTSESHWDDFKADFRAAFTDTDAKITAAEKLNNLKMVGSNIDTYIAEFDRLTDKIRYRKNDWRMLVKFKQGLQPLLLQQIITHHVPAPTHIDAWKKVARECQTVYKELKNAGLTRGGGLSPLQQKWANYLGMPAYRTPAQ
jgi:hypothetical protein